jgi:hypothetical protein
MLRIATILLIVMLSYAGIYAVAELAIPEVIEGITFQSVTGQSLEQLREAGFLHPYVIVARHVGLFALCLVIAVAFIVAAGFRKGEKWSWWAIALVCGIAWMWGLIDSLIIGATINFVLHLIGVALLLAALLLPIRLFFPRQ